VDKSHTAAKTVNGEPGTHPIKKHAVSRARCHPPLQQTSLLSLKQPYELYQLTKHKPCLRYVPTLNTSNGTYLLLSRSERATTLMLIFYDCTDGEERAAAA
jgi:hypothetical protein